MLSNLNKEYNIIMINLNKELEVIDALIFRRSVSIRRVVSETFMNTKVYLIEQ